MATHSASTQNGSRKRRREAPRATANWSAGSSNRSGPFLSNTKRAIQAAAMTCFMCPEKSYHSAHLIEEADRSIPILEKRGLINFKLRSQSNGIGLCPICHYKYDDHRDPKVTFYPTDIEFFIRFELRDRARREKDGSSQRITPTAAQYVRQSGLYNRIQLDWQGSDEAKVLEPAAWNGAPLAALHRTFGMLSCARANGIPKKDRDDLRLLWDLYYGDDDEEVASKAVAIYRNGDGDENFRIGPEFDEFDNSPEGGERTGTGEEDATLGGVSDLEAVDEETEYEEDEEGMPPRKKRALAGTWERAAFDFRQWQWKSGSQSPSNDKADASLPLLGPTSFHH